MAERDWTKAAIYTPDPGAVREVHDTGGVFCGNDKRPFIPESVRRKRANKRAALAIARKRKKASAPTNRPPAEHVSFPVDRVKLITSMLSDLGISLPRRAAKLKAALQRLVQDGLVREDGTINTKHVTALRWLKKVSNHRGE